LSKAKKRLAKELDKLWRAGKYWDWLEQVHAADLVKEFSSQWQEAWQVLSRQALRLPKHLDEFCQRLATLPQAPDLPDILFIRELAAVLAGSPISSQLGQLAGLSPAAQLLRTRLLEWQPNPKAERKIQRLARLCLQQPEQVTGKTYDDLAAAVHPNPLAKLLNLLSVAINRLRRLNRKTGISVSTLQQIEDDWHFLDKELQGLTQAVVPLVRDVLLYPLCSQIWECVRNAWENDRMEIIVHLTTYLPYLAGLTFGPNLGDLKLYAQQYAHSLPRENELIKQLRESHSQDVESKALALGRARNILKEQVSFDRNNLEINFSQTYLAFLRDLARLQPTLAAREQIELQRTLDRILIEDWQLFLNEPEEETFLNLALRSGAGGARISIVALWRQEIHLEPDLLKLARQNLREQPYPGDEIILHLLNLPGVLPFPEVHRLKPVFQAYPQEQKLRQLVVDRVTQTLNITLWLASNQFLQGKAPGRKKESQRLYRGFMERFTAELRRVGDYPELQPLQDLVVAFPEGYFTPMGYQRLMEKVLERSGDLASFLRNMEIYSQTHSSGEGILEILFQDWSYDFISQQDDLLFAFLTQRRSLWEGASLEELQRVVEKYCRINMRLDEAKTNFLLHLLNLLEQRLKEGDPEAARLHDYIFTIILANRRIAKRPGRPRGRRR